MKTICQTIVVLQINGFDVSHVDIILVLSSNGSEYKFMTVIFEPAFLCFVFRHDGIYPLPEFRRMIFFYDVHKLMHDHVINYVRRRHHQPETEGKIVIC